MGVKGCWIHACEQWRDIPIRFFQLHSPQIVHIFSDVHGLTTAFDQIFWNEEGIP
jgi:hypothetical protein